MDNETPYTNMRDTYRHVCENLIAKAELDSRSPLYSAMGKNTSIRHQRELMVAIAECNAHIAYE